MKITKDNSNFFWEPEIDLDSEICSVEMEIEQLHNRVAVNFHSKLFLESLIRINFYTYVIQ